MERFYDRKHTRMIPHSDSIHDEYKDGEYPGNG